MKILVTGAAGFIGYHLVKSLIEDNHLVIGLDNLNDYYDVNLKLNRLSLLESNASFTFKKLDISNRGDLESLFKNYKPKKVVNLAAQAGVRYSLENPNSYFHSNIVGFMNILECCRHNNISNLVYASSSSVYGNDNKFNENFFQKKVFLFYNNKMFFDVKRSILS